MTNNKNDINILIEFLDKYLIEDLETMINEIPGRLAGGLGYPAIHTIITSMELLGKLMTGSKNEKAFFAFWDKYFTQVNSKYKNEYLKKIFIGNIRNGTAHFYLVKSGIIIDKIGENHLRITPENKLRIDLKVLYKDFLTAYNKFKTDIKNKDNLLLPGIDVIKKELNDPRCAVDSYINSIKESNQLEEIIQSIPTNSATASDSVFSSVVSPYKNY